jgi:hypothetical protein
VDLKETGQEGVEWINLRIEKMTAGVEKVMKFLFPLNAQRFFHQVSKTVLDLFVSLCGCFLNHTTSNDS